MLQNGGYYEDCHIKTPSSLARDPNVASELWNTTLSQVDAFLTPDDHRLLNGESRS